MSNFKYKWFRGRDYYQRWHYRKPCTEKNEFGFEQVQGLCGIRFDKNAVFFDDSPTTLSCNPICKKCLKRLPESEDDDE